MIVWPPEEERAKKNPTYYLKMLNPETRATLEQLYQHEEFKVLGLCLALCSARCVLNYRRRSQQGVRGSRKPQPGLR